jgi:hypothetical protein
MEESCMGMDGLACRVGGWLTMVVLSATMAQAQGMCDVPTPPANVNSSNQAMAAYMTGPYRQWCVQHGGSTRRDGGCDMSGPNWKCNLNASNGGTAQPGSSSALQAMTSAMLTTPGNATARGNAAALAGTQNLIGSMMSSILNPTPSGPTPEQLAQIRVQQQQAEEQRRAAEEQRKQQIAADLYGKMKLSDSSVLSPGAAANSNDMQFKLSDDAAPAGHAGVAGLPGIYLNDPTPAPVMQASGMQLKLGDSNTPSQPASSPAPPDSAPPPSDAASGVQPPMVASGMQLKIGDGSAAPAADGQSSGHGSTARTLTAAATSTTAAPDSTASTSATSSVAATSASAATTGGHGSALGQLQTIAASSQQAAASNSLEGASAAASVGFDKPAGASSSAPVALPNASLHSTIAIPQQAANAPAKLSPQVQPPPPLMAKLEPAPLPTVPAPGPSRITQMSDVQLANQIQQVKFKMEMMNQSFQFDVKTLTHAAYASEAAQRKALQAGCVCLSRLLVDAATDGIADKIVDKLAAGETMAKIGKFHVALEKMSMELQESKSDFEESPKQRDDRLERYYSTMQSTYDFLGEVDEVTDHQLLGLSKYGSLAMNYAKCLQEYSTAAADYALQAIEISDVNGTLDDKLKAQTALQQYYKKLIDEQLRRKRDGITVN